MNSLHRPPSSAVAALLLLGAFATSSLRAQRMELSDASASAIIVESAEIKSEVTGRIAVTTFDLVFRNPNGRVLEGTFVLPLLDGQSVTRFALDRDGKLREAVPVEKTKGRIVFEEIERRRVDPGLLEQTAGNNYRARIFPIPAGGTRRIVVAYQEDVARSGDAAYRLNLDFPQPLKNFRLALTAFASGPTAKIRTTLGLDLPAWREGKTLEITRRNFTARGVLELALPPLDRPRVLTGRRGNDEYFYAEAPVALPTRARATPRTVGLLWDSSGSGAERDHAREFALLDAWFANVGGVEVRLIRLRDQAEAAGRFVVRDGNWRALRRELEKTPYDGATSLDGLTDDPAVDEWLLFSDGLINYGVTPADAKLKLRAPVHAVLASPRADPRWLRGFADRQRGEFVNLLEVPAATAATRLRSQSARVLRADYNPSEAIEVFPESGTAITSGPMIITGVFRGERATLQLRVGTSEADAQTIEVVALSGENATPLAPRGWATEKIARLSLNQTANRADIRRTSREFGIVTADTSLIVLETVADYVRYDIAPPDELRREWTAQRRSLAPDRAKNNDAHIESVVRAFEERVAWWEKKIPKNTPRVSQKPESKDRGGVVTLDQFSVNRRGAAPAVQAPPPPASRARRDGEEEIVQLQPFEVSAARDSGFAASSMSSARLATGGRANGAVGSRYPAEPTAEPSAPTITLQRWSPDTGYLDHIRRAPNGDPYAAYLEERSGHARQPGFFLDVANFFFERDEPALALRILSNLAELELEDVALLRVLAHRLTQADRPALALPLFERVLALRLDEPQSRRDLALVCADMKRYQRAVDLLWEIVAQPWSERFPGIEVIALGELNAIAATCGETLDLSRVDPRLQKNLPVQSRVVLTWDANDCDIDLWVSDPNGEVASYNFPLTSQGGRMSRDFTGGYGPEEFLLRAPKPGTYRVKIDYFGDSRQSALGPVTAQLRLITGFGTRAQAEKRLTVRLEEKKQKLEIGTFEIAAPGKMERAAD